MRVVGGEAKGVQLKSPLGRLVRPTTSLVREAIFSILESSANCWDRVLDLYAGSGALGLEALSRGAGWADFVDQNRKCCDIIKYNLGRVRFSDRAHVRCCSANRAIAFLDSSYDVIFVDPPYSSPSTSNVLAMLANSRLIKESSTVVVCHANRFPLDANYSGLYLAKQRRYGDTFISIYYGRTEL